MFNDGADPPNPYAPIDPSPRTTRSALILRREAFDKGFNADDIKRKLARGDWILLRPGAYLQTAGSPSPPSERCHLLQIDAELPFASENAVVSHLSAACEHGIDLLREPGKCVQVTNPVGVSGHRRRLLHTHRAAIDDDEWARIRGHRVTSVARTVIDVARTRSFEEGVVVADSALHQGLVTREELMTAVNRAPRRAGMRLASRVVRFADAGAESVGESRSRVLMSYERIPVPQVQFRITVGDGASVAVSDFGWKEFGTVGEFDGAEKYGRLLVPGERAGDKVFQEKRREDLIRDTGLQVVRWTWDDLDQPKNLADRIRRALDRGLRSGGHAAPRT